MARTERRRSALGVQRVEEAGASSREAPGEGGCAPRTRGLIVDFDYHPMTCCWVHPETGVTIDDEHMPAELIP